MSFATELAKKDFQRNIVVKMDGQYYGMFQVDSDTGDLMGTGSGIPTANVGTINKVRTNPLRVDIRNIRTTLPTASIQFVDIDGKISLDIGNSDNNLLDEEIEIYYGFITDAGFDFADYKLISRTFSKTFTKSPNVFNLNAVAVLDELKNQVFDSFTLADGAIGAGDTSITVDDTSEFESSGFAKIDDEFVSYASKTATTLDSVTRGVFSTTAATHDDDSEIYFYKSTGTVNPLTLLLQLMVSPGGGGTYDVLSDGLGIAESKVDVTGIEAIRDANFSGESFNFELGEIGDGMSFLEEEILRATNCRFIDKGGKISIALLDQIDLSGTPPVIDESSISSPPKWSLNIDKIVNQIIIRWNYAVGQDKYSRTNTFTDSDSISIYGAKKPLELNFKGVRAASGGDAIVLDRGTRLLSRLANPKAQIQVKTHLDKSDIDIGDNVNVTHRYLPQQGAGLGFADQMEVLSKALDFNNGVVMMDLQFTSYHGLRIGLIAPSPLISVVNSQSSVDVADGTCFSVGMKVRLWDDTTQTYYSDAPREIISITGNTLVFDSAFTTTLTTAIRLRLSEYDDASDLQKARYASTSPASDVFDDGVQAYQIFFG